MRLRFSIRDLLLVTTISALAIGWWLDHRKLTKENLAEFTVYYLKYADAKVVSGSLQQLFARNSDVSVTFDPRLNAIFVHGPAKRQDEIEMLLKLTDVSPTASGSQTGQ
jgi:type II secretory pathway component GspD/PulD (secretin)